MRGAEFSGCAHPLEANDEERLGKDEIAEAKFFFEFSTVLLNKMFGLEELLLDLAGCQIDSFCIRKRCASGMRQRRVNKVYQKTLLPNTCFGECWRSSLTALQQLVVDCVQGVWYSVIVYHLKQRRSANSIGVLSARGFKSSLRATSWTEAHYQCGVLDGNTMAAAFIHEFFAIRRERSHVFQLSRSRRLVSISSPLPAPRMISGMSPSGCG